MDADKFAALWPSIKGKEVTFLYGSSDPKILSATFTSLSDPMRQKGRPDLTGRGCHRYLETVEGRIFTVRHILEIKPEGMARSNWIAQRARAKKTKENREAAAKEVEKISEPVPERRPLPPPYQFRTYFPDLQ